MMMTMIVAILSPSVFLQKIVVCVSVFYGIDCLVWAASFTESSLK